LMTAILVGACAAVTLRRTGSGPVLGLLAGMAFGLIGLSVRLLTASPSPFAWLVDPAVYALLLSGALALCLYAAALQRAHVTTTTAVVVTVDALLPAVVGLVLLGDEPASGRGWIAGIGFLNAVCGAVALSRAGSRNTKTDERASIPLAGRQRTPPRRPSTSRSPLRERHPHRTTRRATRRRSASRTKRRSTGLDYCSDSRLVRTATGTASLAGRCRSGCPSMCFLSRSDR
jgi:hypothetical protein